MNLFLMRGYSVLSGLGVTVLRGLRCGVLELKVGDLVVGMLEAAVPSFYRLTLFPTSQPHFLHSSADPTLSPSCSIAGTSVLIGLLVQGLL